LTVTAVTAVYVAAVTPARLIALAPGPPVTVIDVMALDATAPVPGSAPLIFTLPPALVIVIGSAASLVTVSSPAATVEVTAAFAMPGKASTATAAAPASRPVRARDVVLVRDTS